MKFALKLLSVLALCLSLAVLPGIAAADSVVIPYVSAGGAAQTPVKCVLITAAHPEAELQDDWYAVQGDVTISGGMEIYGNVNLILCDGCTLRVNGGMLVYRTARLFIWAQSTGSGKGRLIVTGSENAAGIGGSLDYSAGDIFIRGGDITATGGTNGAGIGGGNPSHGSESSVTIQISGGTVNATGGGNASGIGGGYRQASGDIVITGGTVTATGSQYGAGIGGGGEGSRNGAITISGGTVTASGGSGEGAGIGAAHGFSGGDVTVSGGQVTATGGAKGGAGIGGGTGPSGGNLEGTVTISGGTVTAAGGKGGAGIGGGDAGNARDGRVSISGGTVTATGGSGAAGIGGGSEEVGWGGEGSTVEITGGTVMARSGEGRSSAIGHGDDDEYFGTVTFSDDMMVRAGWSPEECGSSTPFTAGEREVACQYRWCALVEACTHPAPTYDVYPEYHQRTCSYCKTVFPPENHVYPEEESVCSVCGHGYGEVWVIYVLNNGDPHVTKLYDANTSGNVLPAAWELTAPEGKILAGWNILTQDGDVAEFLPPGGRFTVGLVQSLTIEAVWTDKVTVTYDGCIYDEEHFGIVVVDGDYRLSYSEDAAKDSICTIPDLTMQWRSYDGSEKTFRGWCEEGSSHIRQPGYRFVASEDTKFTAVWDAFQVSFDSAGGSDVPAQEIPRLRTAEAPADPVRAGYIFRGWELDGAVYDFSVSVAEDITLEAVWEKIVFGEPDFVLPEGILMVEESAFEGVSPTAVWIPDGCREIEPWSFRNCRNLQKIRIPAGCAIGEFAFDGCTHVYILGTPGGGAEQYCEWHENCEFVPEEPVPDPSDPDTIGST